MITTRAEAALTHRLSQLPDDLLADADVLAVIEAAAGYGGTPPADALTHAVFNDPARGTAAVERLQGAGVLGDQGLGDWFPAAEALLASDPDRIDLLGRLCRYEGALLQAFTVASRETLHPGLVERTPRSGRLAVRAVAAGVGLPAADLAAAVAAALCLVPQGTPERIVNTTALEVEAAGRAPDARRLDRAKQNHALALDWAGRPSEALTVLRQRLVGPQRVGDAIRTAIIALHAGKSLEAEQVLIQGLSLATSEGDLLALYLSLAQLRLTEHGDASTCTQYLAKAEPLLIEELRPDHGLLAAVADEEAGFEDRAARAFDALAAAIGAGTPHRGRVCDRWVRLAARDRISPAVHAAVLLNASKAQSRGPHFAAWVVVQGFLTARSANKREPRLEGMAADADKVTGGRWQFTEWTPSAAPVL